jgi:hypothetical protein
MQQQGQTTGPMAVVEERAESRSSADFRRLALHEERLAEAADLPAVREKHRIAARSWIAMARSFEKRERLRGDDAERALAS